jgi:Integrase core domain
MRLRCCMVGTWKHREIFATLTEAQVLAEGHRVYHNLDRPHSSLGYLTPAEFTALDGPQVLLPRVAGEASDSPEIGEKVFTLS